MKLLSQPFKEGYKWVAALWTTASLILSVDQLQEPALGFVCCVEDRKVDSEAFGIV